ncbi:MAG TPA: class II glutamine amidotransferase [Thermoplasmata archaeon]|nr:class II glutamine amidotransferase [Thermoplasmata archaeon]
MCRLFAQLTTQPESAEPWLVHRSASLLAQSNASPETAQKDGWGIGWFTDEGRARVEKGTGGAFQDGERERYLRAAQDASGSLVIGHLRHASNPLNLPSAQLIGLENSQPFEDHTALFAHNGSIPFPVETRPLTGLYEPRIRGVNDSEVLFWLLVRNVHEHDDPLTGFVQSVADLYRIWEGEGRPAIPPFSGLNVVYSPGPSDLWAFCLWTGDHGDGLLDPHRRYYEMAYQAHPHRVIVGSEPFDREPGVWRSMEAGSYLHARRRSTHVELETGRLPLPATVELRPPPT